MKLGRIGLGGLGCGRLAVWSYALRLVDGKPELKPVYPQMFANRRGHTSVDRVYIQEYELALNAVVVPHEQGEGT